MNRRRFLGAFAAGLSTLAGCGSSGGPPEESPVDGPTDSPTRSPTHTRSETPTGDGTTPPTETQTPTDGATPTPDRTPTGTPKGGGTPTRTPYGGGTPTPAPGAELENGSFEDGLRGWTVGRDLPADPNNPDRKVGSEADVTAHVASQGNQAVEFFLDGVADDGTIWVAQEADLAGVETLAVDGYSETESFNTVAKLAVYAGPVPGKGLAEADFDTERATEDHEGWKTYEYEVSHDGPGLVAVGISVVWETGVRRQLDDVRLSAG
ncbi:MAG: hypothetical protein ABEH66_02635 [Halobacteriales archaeon]